MKYKNLNVENEIHGYNTRIQQLEEEHLSNTIYIFEAELIEDEVTVKKLKATNASIEYRLEKLNARVDELSELLPNSEDQNGTTTTD